MTQNTINDLRAITRILSAAESDACLPDRFVADQERSRWVFAMSRGSSNPRSYMTIKTGVRRTDTHFEQFHSFF